MSLSGKELRILGVLNTQNDQYPGEFVRADTLMSLCELDFKKIISSIKILHDTGCVEAQINMRLPGNTLVRITTDGIFTLRSGGELPSSSNNTSVNVSGNNMNIGNIQGQGTISGDVSNVQNFFAELEKRIQNSPDISEEEKSTILGKIKDLSSHPIVTNITTELFKLGIMG